MKITLSSFTRIALFISGISIVSIPTIAQADWSIVGLGTLGGDTSFATGINDSGFASQ